MHSMTLLFDSPEVDDFSDLVATFHGDDKPDWNLMEVALYQRLRSVAYRITGHSDASVSFGATSVTHEAFAKLAVRNRHQQINDVPHFLAIMATVMKQVFIDHVRKKQSWKAGGRSELIPLEYVIGSLMSSSNSDYDAIHECLSLLNEKHPRSGEILEMQVFLGLTVNEITDAFQVSKSTIEKELRFAKAFMKRVLDADDLG